MRLLILGILIYICYRSLKSWLGPRSAIRQPEMGGAVDKVDDVMVKDPVCEVYFPKRNGFRFKLGGKDLYFCSKECRDKFVATQSS